MYHNHDLIYFSYLFLLLPKTLGVFAQNVSCQLHSAYEDFAVCFNF